MQTKETETPARAILALVLDDSDFDRERLCRIGRNSGLDIEISAVPTISEMEEKLDSEDFDLVLIDYRLGEGDGIDALDRVKRHPRNNTAATVMVTGNGGADVAVRAMRRGCDDYLEKDALTPAIFKSRMVAALERVVAVGEARLSDALSPIRLRQAFLAAFDQDTVQRVLAPALRPLLIEALRAALRDSNIAGSPEREQEFATFVEGFLEPDQPDQFVFRS